MKKTVSLVVCFFIVSLSYAQMAVTDIGVSTQLAASETKSSAFFGKSIAQAVAQVNQLISLKEKYNDQINLVKEVNSYLSGGNEILRIKSRIVDITQEYSKGLSYIKNEPTIDYQSKGVLINGYSVKLKESLSVFEDAIRALSSNLNMNDSERLFILNSSEQKLKDQERFLIYLRNKITYSVEREKQKKSDADFIKNEVESINKGK